MDDPSRRPESESQRGKAGEPSIGQGQAGEQHPCASVARGRRRAKHAHFKAATRAGARDLHPCARPCCCLRIFVRQPGAPQNPQVALLDKASGRISVLALLAGAHGCSWRGCTRMCCRGSSLHARSRKMAPVGLLRGDSDTRDASAIPREARRDCTARLSRPVPGFARRSLIHIHAHTNCQMMALCARKCACCLRPT